MAGSSSSAVTRVEAGALMVVEHAHTCVRQVGERLDDGVRIALLRVTLTPLSLESGPEGLADRESNAGPKESRVHDAGYRVHDTRAQGTG